jgi:hypothetical protein
MVVLVRSPEKDWQYLSNAAPATPLGEVVAGQNPILCGAPE